MQNQCIIPIIVPHKKDTIFSYSKKGSQLEKEITTKEVKNSIDNYLKKVTNENVSKELAFIGGGLMEQTTEKQEQLLQVAYQYIQEGKIDSIRILAKPNDITKANLKILKKYKVKTIELESESSNNYILQKAKLDYTLEGIKKASKLIKWYGFELGHQIMIGLPESTKLDEINTAKELIKLKPKMVTIDLVVIRKDTKLEEQYREGFYEPLSMVQAVERCKELVYLYNRKKIHIIRIGLQDDCEEKENEIIEGPFHPAFRQLVESSIWYDSIVDKIKQYNVKVKEVEVQVNSEDLDNVIGYEKENLTKLKETYDVDIKVIENNKLKVGKSEMKIIKTYTDFIEEQKKEKIGK